MAVSNLTQGLDGLRRELLRGLVIPAHPLALTGRRALDDRRQVALTRYYCDAGAGGLAVAVHTTQFEIRKPEVGLLQPVLELAMQAARDWCGPRRPRPIMVAGVVGRQPQAMHEAELAARLGYDAALLSLAALKDADNAALLEHCRAVANRPSAAACSMRRSGAPSWTSSASSRSRSRRSTAIAPSTSLAALPRAAAPTSRSTRETTMPSWRIWSRPFRQQIRGRRCGSAAGCLANGRSARNARSIC
jgi:hypothetical protein